MNEERLLGLVALAFDSWANDDDEVKLDVYLGAIRRFDNELANRVYEALPDPEFPLTEEEKEINWLELDYSYLLKY